MIQLGIGAHFSVKNPAIRHDGTNADVVRLDADFQILPTKAVSVESSGLLDLNGHSERLARA